MSWKSLFGSGELTELPKELTDLLAQSKRDSKALRELLKRSETAAKKFERLVDPLEAMQATAKSLNAQMSELQGRVDSFGEAVSTIDAVAGQAAGLAESQAAHVSSNEEADSKIGELTTKVTELRTVVEGAMTAKDEVAELVGPESPVAQLLEEVKSVRADLRQAEERTTALGESVSRFAVLEQ